MSNTLNKTIHDLAEKALVLNRTFSDGTHAKNSLWGKPTGFLPPDKRAKVMDILEEISNLTKDDNTNPTN